MFLQFLKASVPISKTFLPIDTLVKPLQYSKANAPIVLTLSPIITLVKPVQLSKEALSIVSPLVISTTNEAEFVWAATVLVFVAEPVILVRPLQPLKA